MPAGLHDVLALQFLTFPSSNVSSAGVAGFEVLNGRDTLFLGITNATFDGTLCYVSPFFGTGEFTIDAAQAVQLPGVTPGERLTVLVESYVDSLEGDRSAGLEVRFYDDSANENGIRTAIECTEAGAWEPQRRGVTVPVDATRVNFVFRTGCDAGESIRANFANLRIVR